MANKKETGRWSHESLWFRGLFALMLVGLVGVLPSPGISQSPCTDADGDGVCAIDDCDDLNPFCAATCGDLDGDSYCDDQDNCPSDFNPDQASITKLNEPPVSDGTVGGDFLLSADSTTVVYHANFDLYSVPIGGGTVTQLTEFQLVGSAFQRFLLSADSTTVVYRAGGELYSVPIGGGINTKLNGLLVSGGEVEPNGFLVSADSTTVVYLASQDSSTVRELYSVPIEGGTVTKLSGSMIPGGDIQPGDFLVTPDSTTVVYRADQDTDELFELYSVPIDGGIVTKLNGLLPAAGDVFQGDFLVSADSTTVVYIADQDTNSVRELYSVPIGGGIVTRLTGPMGPGFDVLLGEFFISADSTTVVYIAKESVGTTFELFSVPIDGGTVTKLNGPLAEGGAVSGFSVSGDSTTVVSIADQDTDNIIELYSVPIGGGTITKLNGPIVAGGPLQCCDFLVSADSATVVYSTDQDTDRLIELYSVPIGGGTVTKLNALLVADGNVRSFRVSGDSAIVVYRADQDTRNVIGLYSVPIGGGAVTKLNAPVETTGDVQSRFLLSPDSTTLVYRAAGLYSVGLSTNAAGMDRDGDSFGFACDCDDVNPNCTTDCTDADGDSFCITTDCDDANPNCTTDCTDADGDNFCITTDCDDTAPSCTTDCSDADGDGFVCAADCDDANPNCTTDCTDFDGDNFCITTDCNDTNPNCTTDCSDADGDGFACAVDCDDTNPNCTTDCTDADGDGFCVTTDCDDTKFDCTTDCSIDADGDGLDCVADCDDTKPYCTTDCTDADGDDFCITTDCDDANPNCTTDCTDADGDGFCITTDCDDANPNGCFGPVGALNSNAASDTNSDYAPQVTTDGMGNWVAVWYSFDSLGGTIGSDTDILVARSTDAGASWSAPMALNSNAASDTGNDFHQQLTTDGAGNWVAVWSSFDSLGGTIGSDTDILVALSTDTGASWSAPVALNSNAASDLGSDVSPQVTTDSEGNWVAVWSSLDSLGGTTGSDDTFLRDQDILVARSTDAGVSWSVPVALNTNAAFDSGHDFRPKLTTDGTGNWVAVWTSNDRQVGIGTDPDIIVARSTDAGASWSDPMLLNAPFDSGWDGGPDLATDGVGNWVAVWHSFVIGGGPSDSDHDILMARSTDAGASWSTTASLNSNAASDTGDDRRPRVTTDGAGNWVVVWYSDESLGGTVGQDNDILEARSTDAGASWSDPMVLNSNAASDTGRDENPQLTTDGAGNWVAVWESFDSLGGTIGTDPDIFFATGVGPDKDGDGLSDGAEVNVHGTDPLVADTDGDGLSDGAEVNVHGTDPLVADTDGDGLSDGAEVNVHGTDPLLADSDGDGLSDGSEVDQGTDPLNPDTTPPEVLCTVTPMNDLLQFNYSASDVEGVTITSAALRGGNSLGSCMIVPVSDGQIYNANCGDTCTPGFFSTEAPDLSLEVTARDPAGNVTTCSAVICDQVEMILDTDAVTGEDTVLWSGRLGASAFRVIRGNLGLPQSNPPQPAAECMARVLPGVQPQQITTSQVTLSPGSALFYLVATESPGGVVSFGIGGDGNPRPVIATTCPAGL